MIELRKLALPAILFVLLIAPCTCAKKTVLLENRFAKGEELRYRLRIKGEGVAGVGGLPGQKEAVTETPITQDTEITYRMVVQEVNANGDAVIALYFDSFASTTDSSGLKIRIEADEKGARLIQGETVTRDAPGLQGLSALFKRPTTITMSKRGEILSATEPEDTGPLLPHMDIINLIKQSQFVLPGGPVPLGYSWKDERDLMLPGAVPSQEASKKEFKFDVTYTLARIVNRGNRALAEISVRGATDSKGVETDLPQEEKSGRSVKMVFERLKQDVSGNIYFDPAKGYPLDVQLDINQDLVMMVTISQAESKMTFTTTSKMKLATEMEHLE